MLDRIGGDPTGLRGLTLYLVIFIFGFKQYIRQILRTDHCFTPFIKLLCVFLFFALLPLLSFLWQMTLHFFFFFSSEALGIIYKRLLHYRTLQSYWRLVQISHMSVTDQLYLRSCRETYRPWSAHINCARVTEIRQANEAPVLFKLH